MSNFCTNLVHLFKTHEPFETISAKTSRWDFTYPSWVQLHRKNIPLTANKTVAPVLNPCSGQISPVTRASVCQLPVHSSTQIPTASETRINSRRSRMNPQRHVFLLTGHRCSTAASGQTQIRWWKKSIGQKIHKSSISQPHTPNQLINIHCLGSKHLSVIPVGISSSTPKLVTDWWYVAPYWRGAWMGQVTKSKLSAGLQK